MHTKKIIVSCFLLLSMSACSRNEPKPKTPTPKISQKSIKRDEKKDYLYSSDIYTVELTSEQLTYLKKEINTIHTLVINIDSRDAEGINKILSDISENHIHDIVKLPNGEIQSFTGYNGTSYESDKFISIITTENPYVWQSDMQSELHHAYIFNREDGTLVTQKELLQLLHLDEDAVIKQAKQIIEKSGDKLCGDLPTECYQEPVFYHDTDNANPTIMYVNKDNDLVLYVKKQHGLVYNWEPLILPQ